MSVHCTDIRSDCALIILFVLLIISSISPLGIISQVTAESPIEISVQGASKLQAGDQINLSVRAEAVHHSGYSIQWTLEYDATALEITSVSKGGFLSQNSSSVVVTKHPDDIVGQTEYAEVRTGTDEGVTNNGTISNFTLQGANNPTNQTTQLQFSNLKISDTDENSLPTTSQNVSLRADESETATGIITRTTTAQESKNWRTKLSEDVKQAMSDRRSLPIIVVVNDSESMVRTIRTLETRGGNNITKLESINSISSTAPTPAIEAVAKLDEVEAIRYDRGVSIETPPVSATSASTAQEEAQIASPEENNGISTSSSNGPSSHRADGPGFGFGAVVLALLLLLLLAIRG